MLSFKNVKIKKDSKEITVDLDIINQEFLKAIPGREYSDFFLTKRGMVQIDVETVKEKIKNKIALIEQITEEKVKEALNSVLKELQNEYNSLKQNDNFCFEYEIFTGNSVETSVITFDKVEADKGDFFLKEFDVEDLIIEENNFSGKIKNFLQRFKDSRYQDIVYVFNDFSPEEYTKSEEVKYDLFALRYEVYDNISKENKTVYNTVPVQILCKIFNLKPYDLFEGANNAISRAEYQNMKY